MKFEPTRIPDVVRVVPQIFGDERGFFMETWQVRKFAAAGIAAALVQDNHSRSSRGTLRGLHMQVHKPQGKLVRVIAGEIFDVAVDLRRGSSTYSQWVSEVLSAENKLQLWIPPGFAHGFYVLSETADVLYKATDFWAPKFERTLAWDEPRLAIPWPLVGGGPPTLSPKDAVGLGLAALEREL